MEYGLLVGGWFAYFLLHSLLASLAVKHVAERALGRAFRFYRAAYSFVAVGGLVTLMWLNGSIEAPFFVEPQGLLRILSFVLTLMGAMIIQTAFRQYRLWSFLGFGSEPSVLRRHGILGVIRHPIYSGIILITMGLFLFVPNMPTLISCMSIFIYIPIGIALEEKKLVKEYGQLYLDYCKEVPALIPRKRRITGS